MAVHLFGAYFGLTASIVGHKKNVMEMNEQGSINHSDLFSMIGQKTIYEKQKVFQALSSCGSSFHPLMLQYKNPVEQCAKLLIVTLEDARHRAIMNTYLAMASGTVTTFLLSSWHDNLGRFNMMHIQSSTLAGGVAIGKCLVFQPTNALKAPLQMLCSILLMLSCAVLLEVLYPSSGMLI